jgi:hypothetical protein
MLNQLQQSYEEQLIKSGVSVSRAKTAAMSLSESQLLMIQEIWRDWQPLTPSYQ